MDPVDPDPDSDPQHCNIRGLMGKRIYENNLNCILISIATVPLTSSNMFHLAPQRGALLSTLRQVRTAHRSLDAKI